MTQNKITKKDIILISEYVIDDLGESINNEICNRFGNGLDCELYERIGNIVYSQIKLRM